jgi:uncharacterized protein with HEPN domain
VKHERTYLGHIRYAINDIEEYASAGREAFTAHRMRQDAVIRKLEIIGEAVKNLTEDTKTALAGNPVETDRWDARSVDARYFGVDLELVWRVTERDLQTLKFAVIDLLSARTG